MNNRTFLFSTALFLATATVGLVSVSGEAAAQSRRAATSSFLSIAEIERRAISEGLVVTEIEVESRLAEVKGRDSQQRKVKLVIDRRTGEVLQRNVKEHKLFN